MSAFATAEPQVLSTGLALVLWVDDNPGAVESLRRQVANEPETLGLQINVVKSGNEALREVATGNYDALVMDCKLDEFDDFANGAVLLLEINQTSKDLPTFVYSGFLTDEPYLEPLLESYAILQLSKLETFEQPLSRDPFFRALSLRARQHAAVKTCYPEKIEFHKYLKNSAKYAKEVDTHWQKYGYWIQTEMARRGYAWCVVCGDNIVRGSKNPFDYPDEESLMHLGHETNLIPFAYSAPLHPEESYVPDGNQWHPTKHEGDYYPTIRLRIATTDIEDDFDTGAVRTHVSNRLVQRGLVDFWRESEHLGQPYRFFSKTVPASVTGSDGRVETGFLAVNVVEDWERSPFVLVNKKRGCLVGRDVLHSFDLEVVLNSAARATSIRILGRAQPRAVGQPYRGTL